MCVLKFFDDAPKWFSKFRAIYCKNHSNLQFIYMTAWNVQGEISVQFYSKTEAEFLEEIHSKVLRVFLLAIHSHSIALPWDFCFFKLTQPLTVSQLQLLYNVKEKAGKSDRKPNPIPYGLRNPHRNLKFENSQDYAQKPHQNCMWPFFLIAIIIFCIFFLAGWSVLGTPLLMSPIYDFWGMSEFERRVLP